MATDTGKPDGADPLFREFSRDIAVRLDRLEAQGMGYDKTGGTETPFGGEILLRSYSTPDGRIRFSSHASRIYLNPSAEYARARRDTPTRA